MWSLNFIGDNSFIYGVLNCLIILLCGMADVHEPEVSFFNMNG